jgi:hypothetical protein
MHDILPCLVESKLEQLAVDDLGNKLNDKLYAPHK